MTNAIKFNRECFFKNIIFIIFIFSLSQGLPGRIPGVKHFINFTPSDYEQQPQNWCVVQDKRGLIYVGNHGGLLEYDGVTWKLIEIPNKIVRSLDTDKNGTVFVGGINEFGYMMTFEEQGLKYCSLVHYLRKAFEQFYKNSSAQDLKHSIDQALDFGEVWRTHTTDQGVYFRTSNWIFCWSPTRKEMKIWKPENNATGFNASFVCHNRFFINQKGIGLMEMKNDTLQLLPGGEQFAKEATPFMLVPYDSASGKLLIGIRELGFFIYNGQGMTPLQNSLDSYFKSERAGYGIPLKSSPGKYAIATLQGGLAVMNTDGTLDYLFKTENGLQSNNIKQIFEDQWGNLWLALEKGVTKVEYASPFTYYDEYSDLKGLVYSVLEHNNQLYVGTSFGLHYLPFSQDVGQLQAGFIKERFQTVEKINGSCWSLLPVDDTLLVANNKAVYRVKNNIAEEILPGNSFILHRSLQNPSRLWVGHTNGLISLLFNSQTQKWEIEFLFPDITQTIRNIAEDNQGNLWISSSTSGVIHIIFSSFASSPQYRLEKFGEKEKLPGDEIRPFNINNHICFCTIQGIYRYNDSQKHFIGDSLLGKDYAGGEEKARGVYLLTQNPGQSIWVHSESRTFLAEPQENGSYQLKKSPFSRIPITQVNCIHHIPEKAVTWFATSYALIRYDALAPVKSQFEHSTLIRKVTINGNQTIVDPLGASTPQIYKPSFRDFRFEVAAPFYDAESRTAYMFFLEGYEKDWSTGSEPIKTYTNLDPGTYTFKVKARDIYDVETKESIFSFRILTPWYQTVWAYILYGLLFFALLFLGIKWRSLRLENEKKRLEQIVSERNREVIHKNKQLEEQSEQLKELDHAKSRFFANISHEFRTPLTLIIDPLQQLFESTENQEQRKSIDRMRRSAHRLLALINRLLDLSRLDSGKMPLKASPQDVIVFLKGINALFEEYCRKNKIKLQFLPDDPSIIFYFDSEKLEEVFYNLIFNAVKYTPANGKISIFVKQVNKPIPDFPEGYVEISVQDTGMGISKEYLSHIFERFHQGDSTNKPEHKYKGSGIGLALTRELVMLHHGKIEVHSREAGKNSGTEFILRFPLGRTQFSDNEIVPAQVPISDPLRDALHQSEMSLLEGEDPTKSGNGYDEKSEALDHPNGKPTILVVEDNADMRAYIKESLSDEYQVVEAVDGEIGMQKAEEVMPDIIISDIMMPKIEGDRMCCQLKKMIITSHIPVVLLTAKAENEDFIKGWECGADDYITKPFSTKQLRARIKNLVDQRRQLQKSIQKQLLLHPQELKVSPIDQTFIKDLQTHIEQYLDKTNLSVEKLAELMKFSRITLNKKIKALTGDSANHYIRNYRLERAMQMLKSTAIGNILNIAMETGFGSSAYFTKCFREKYDMLPSDVLNAEKQKDSTQPSLG